MALTLVGAVGASTTSVTPPTGAVGDLMIVFAYRTASNTAPTLPALWTNLDNTGGSSNAFRCGYKIATATGDSSGTWTNATEVLLFRISGQVADPGWIGGTTKNTGTGTTVTYGAVTLTSSGSNWMVSFAGAASATVLGTRTGYNRDITQGSAPLSAGEHLRNPGGTLQTVTATGSGTFITFQQEILAIPVTATAARATTATIAPTATTAKPVTATVATAATISPSATSSKPVAASRATAATISPSATTAKPIAAAPTFTATRTATATSSKPAASARSTTATITPTATSAKTVTAARTTSVTISPAVTASKPVTSARATTASITADATVTPGGTAVSIDAAPTFTAAITPTATVAKPVTAARGTTGTITPAGTVAKPIAATRPTLATVTPSATSAKPVAASIGVAVARTPVAVTAKPDSAAVASTATFTASPAVSKPVAAVRATTATLTAAVGVARVATATRTTAVAITPVAVTTKPVAASLAVTAQVVADAEVRPPPSPIEFTFGRPGNAWSMAGPTVGWTWTPPTDAWSLAGPATTWTLTAPDVTWTWGEPMTEQYSALSVQYVPVPVQGKRAGQPINPTTDDVFLAFMDGRRPPADDDWVAGSWDTTATPSVYLAQALIGPGTDAVLTPGTYSVWVKIVDDPETPVDQVGEITVY